MYRVQTTVILYKPLSQTDMCGWSQRSNNRSLDGTTLTRISEEKDLGVIITSTPYWDSHIHIITAKANKLLGWLKRTCPLLRELVKTTILEQDPPLG